MRTPPPDLDPATLVEAISRRWGIRLRRATHQPVGFGSYHWLGDDGRRRWWITVDDLGVRRAAAGDSFDDAYDGLRAAMAAVSDAGCPFVVGPRRTDVDEPVARLSERYAAVVRPYVDGRPHEWGEALDRHGRAAVVDVLAALHQVPVATAPSARVDAQGFDHRDVLERAITRAPVARAGVRTDGVGPYAASAAALVREHRDVLASVLDRFDEVTQEAGADPDRLVLTHGEPHPGNLLERDRSWILIDWDTVRVAPPERDLWMLADRRVYPAPAAEPVADDGDGRPVVAADPVARYEAATGVALDRSLLDAFRVRWDLADVASYLHQFALPHAGTADDDDAWANLRSAVDRLAGGGSARSDAGRSDRTADVVAAPELAAPELDGPDAPSGSRS